jgi:hypothetical protein
MGFMWNGAVSKVFALPVVVPPSFANLEDLLLLLIDGASAVALKLFLFVCNVVR